MPNRCIHVSGNHQPALPSGPNRPNLFIRLSGHPSLGGFREGYSKQHILLNFLQRCKSSIDNKGLAGDLSEAFQRVNPDLLVA